eukprot:347587-Chlamydomonas_euryale.AAC.1
MDLADSAGLGTCHMPNVSSAGNPSYGSNPGYSCKSYMPINPDTHVDIVRERLTSSSGTHTRTHACMHEPTRRPYMPQ